MAGAGPAAGSPRCPLASCRELLKSTSMRQGDVLCLDVPLHHGMGVPLLHQRQWLRGTGLSCFDTFGFNSFQCLFDSSQASDINASILLAICASAAFSALDFASDSQMLEVFMFSIMRIIDFIADKTGDN